MVGGSRRDGRELVAPIGDGQGQRGRRRQAVYVLLGLSIAAVAVAMVGLGMRNDHAGARRASELLPLWVKDWSTESNGVEEKVQEEEADYPLLDGVRVLNTGSDEAVQGGEYCFARINQDRALCGKQGFSYYKINSAQARITDGGYRMKLELLVEDKYIYSLTVDRMPEFKDRVPASTRHKDQIPGLLGLFKIRSLEPSPCAGNESAPAPASNEIEWPKNQPEHIARPQPPPSPAPAPPQPASNGNINWDRGFVWPNNATWQRDGITWPTYQARQATKLGYKPPNASEVLRIKSQTTMLLLEEIPGPRSNRLVEFASDSWVVDEYDASERFSFCKAFTPKDQKSCGSCYAFAAASVYSVGAFSSFFLSSDRLSGSFVCSNRRKCQH
eukprot:767202-Hanusia_phi.AAC.2